MATPASRAATRVRMRFMIAIPPPGPTEGRSVSGARDGDQVTTARGPEVVHAEVDRGHAGADLAGDRVVAGDVHQRAHDTPVEPVGAVRAEELLPEREPELDAPLLRRHEGELQEA